MQTTANFSTGDVFGTVRRANKMIDDFDKAVMTRTLLAQYSGVHEAIRAAFSLNEAGDAITAMEAMVDPMVSAALTIYNGVSDFIAVAVRVTQVSGVNWCSASSTAADINATFRLWLADTALRGAIGAAITELDNPNGAVAGVPTEAQVADPLSDNAAPLFGNN